MASRPTKGKSSDSGVQSLLGYLSVGGIVLGLCGFGWHVLGTVLLVPAIMFVVNLGEWLLAGPSEAAP